MNTAEVLSCIVFLIAFIRIIVFFITNEIRFKYNVGTTGKKHKLPYGLSIAEKGHNGARSYWCHLDWGKDDFTSPTSPRHYI